MVMVADTRYAILGLLARRQSHGYELAMRFDELFGRGWEINRGQVYDMLGTLEEKHLIEGVPGHQGGRKVKRYRITQAGECVLGEWLARPCTDAPPQRETLYLKLALARPQDAQHLLQSIALREQSCLDRLRAYAESTDRMPAGANDWEMIAREIIDEATTTQLHGDLEWLSKMRARIERALESAADSGATLGDDPGATLGDQTRARDSAAA
jgi:DNA-binding PadR family transcriptional regulator